MILLMVVLITVSTIVLFPGSASKKADIITYESSSTDNTIKGKNIGQGKLREIALSLVSSTVNNDSNYKNQYSNIKDYKDNNGYTAGVIGFTSRYGQLQKVVDIYLGLKKEDNIIAPYKDALTQVKGTYSHQRLGNDFELSWVKACTDKEMIEAQNSVINSDYLIPAVSVAIEDGLSPLGQYIYFDTMLNKGVTANYSFNIVRNRAISKVNPPNAGGDERKYLEAFLDARDEINEGLGIDNNSVAVQRMLLNNENYKLNLPIIWKVNDKTFEMH